MSDHRYITFELTDVEQEVKLCRNPRKTDWGGYEKGLTEKVKQLSVRLSTGCEIEHCADSLRECIVRSYENNCSLNSKADGHGKIWWSPKLSALKKEVRRQQFIPNEGRQEIFKGCPKEYRKELERAGIRSWQKYCSEVDSFTDAVRLCRVLRNGTPRQVRPLKTSSIYTRVSLPCQLQEYACEGEQKLELFAISLAPRADWSIPNQVI